MATLLLNQTSMTLGWHHVSEVNQLQDQVTYSTSPCPICTPQDKLEILKAARKIYSADEWERRVQLVSEGKK